MHASHVIPYTAWMTDTTWSHECHQDVPSNVLNLRTQVSHILDATSLVDRESLGRAPSHHEHYLRIPLPTT